MSWRGPEGWQTVRNFLSLSGGEVLSKLFTLAAFAWVARIVGPAGFGYLELAGAVVLCAGLFVDLGFGAYGAREIARRPQATATLVAEVTSLRFLIAALVYAGLAVLVLVLEQPAQLERLVLVYGLVLLLMPLMLQWVFQGHDLMREVAVMQVVRQGVFAVLVLALVRDAERLWLVALAEVGGAAALAVVSLWLYKLRFGRSVRLVGSFSRPLLIEGGTIGLGQIFWSLRLYGATLVVGVIAGSTDVGYFGAATRIAIGLNAFVWLYFFNLLPSMSRTWIEGGGAFQRLIKRSLETSGWLTAGGALFWLLLAPAVIRLAYGSEFTPAVTPLRWLSGVCILAAVHGHFRYGLIAAGRQRDSTISMGIGTVVALALIPVGYRYQGISGAAMALVIGEFAVLVAAYLYGRQLNLERPLQQLVRPAVCGALLMGALFWLLPEGTQLWVRLSLAAMGLGLSVYLFSRFRGR